MSDLETSSCNCHSKIIIESCRLKRYFFQRNANRNSAKDCISVTNTEDVFLGFFEKSVLFKFVCS